MSRDKAAQARPDLGELIQDLLYGNPTEKNMAKHAFHDALTPGQKEVIKLRLLVNELDRALDVIDWTRNHDANGAERKTYDRMHEAVRGARDEARRMHGRAKTGNKGAKPDAGQ